MRPLFIIIILLYSVIGFSQQNEFEIRKSTLGKIIDNPEIERLEKLSMDYRELSDSIYENDGFPIWHCRKNCFHVFVDNDSLFVEWKPSISDSLRQKVFYFLKNQKNDILLSDSSLFYENDVYISKGVVVLQYDTNMTSFTQRALREIAWGINDYRNFISIEAFKNDYSELNSEDSFQINNSILWRLILEWKIEIPPPPPPAEPPTIIEIKE